MYLYRTYFKLTNDVIDFEEARRYLIEDDMTVYLKDDNRRCSPSTGKKIVKIEWILKEVDSGHIDLTTTEELTQAELDNISDWVRGQNSDGLGEGFEQQDFAFYSDEEYEDYDDENYDYDYDDYTIMASFDWKTNDYKFELVSKDK